MTDTTGAMTESQTDATPATQVDEERWRDRETTEEGRYIPYAGGCMGWFENSGVLKCESGNNYLFYTAMTSDLVRSKQFQRWGERFNRRGDRRRVKTMTGVSLGTGRDAIRGTSRDISRHGIRVQFLQEVNLTKGDTAHIRVHQSEEAEAVVFEADARVVWSERIGKIRPVWNVGMTLENLTEEQSRQLDPLLQD